jgi:hypothetical protein
LKCCLNYELETYIQELVDIPRVEKSIQTEKGEAVLVKTDIFKKKMWFFYRGEHTWYEVPTTRVTELLALNKAGKKAIALTVEEEYAVVQASEPTGPINSDLRSLDERFRDRDRRQKQERRSDNRRGGGGPPQAGGGAQGPRPGRGPRKPPGRG